MPRIEQHDWDNLIPKQKNKNIVNSGTKDFNTYEYINARKNSKNGDVKITRKAVNEVPTFFTCSRCRYPATDRIDFREHWLKEH